MNQTDVHCHHMPGTTTLWSCRNFFCSRSSRHQKGNSMSPKSRSHNLNIYYSFSSLCLRARYVIRSFCSRLCDNWRGLQNVNNISFMLSLVDLILNNIFVADVDTLELAVFETKILSTSLDSSHNSSPSSYDCFGLPWCSPISVILPLKSSWSPKFCTTSRITVNLFVFTPHVTVNTHNNFLIDFPSFLNTAIQKYNVLNNWQNYTNFVSKINNFKTKWLIAFTNAFKSKLLSPSTAVSISSIVSSSDHQ